MIHFHRVSKDFGGPLRRLAGSRVRALDELSLEVEPGVALAIAGPNGAGKTTLTRLLLGYLRPTSGRVRVDGLPPRRYVEKNGVGYLSERVDLPPQRTVRWTLRAFAALGDAGDDAEAAIDRELDRFGLSGVAGRRLDALSAGTLQRVGLAQAFLLPRKVLVLDEPFHGQDPVWTVKLRQALAGWRAADPGRVLLLVSHDLGQLARLSDRVAVLREGRLAGVLEPPHHPSLAARYRRLLGCES
ncbi:MAG: ABC transporter ATP-binding protein [Longimicrobiaceae bacterium]